jgi:excisionase family DNA binding protein
MPKIEDSEYSVEGLSHLLGIPRDVILHEITTGELKAQRTSGHTVCLDRTDVLDWLNRRGPGV